LIRQNQCTESKQVIGKIVELASIHRFDHKSNRQITAKAGRNHAYGQRGEGDTVRQRRILDQIVNIENQGPQDYRYG
jgi:hypothetical protein